MVCFDVCGGALLNLCQEGGGLCVRPVVVRTSILATLRKYTIRVGININIRTIIVFPDTMVLVQRIVVAVTRKESQISIRQ